MEVQKDNDSSLLLKEIQDIHREIKGFICKHMRLPHPHDLFEVVGKITLSGHIHDPLKDEWRGARFDLSEGDTIIINEVDFDGASEYRGEIMYIKDDTMHDATLDRETVHSLIKGGWIELVTPQDDK